MSSKREKTISELIKEYEDSMAYKLYNFLLRSNHARYIFEDNYRELSGHVSKYEYETTSSQKTFKDKSLPRIKSRNRLRKFIKYFHNYASATYSLEEHYDKFFSSIAYKKTKQKFSSLYEEPLRLFIFAVRNNITHYTIPPISVSVQHKKNKTIKGETLFVTKGHFNMSKSAILSDHWKAQPIGKKKNHSSSRFLENDNKRKVLCAYISKEYRGRLSIDLKDIVKKHQDLFLKYLEGANKEIVAMDETEYRKTEKLVIKV